MARRGKSFSATIIFRSDESDHLWIKEMAAHHGLTISEYMRVLVKTARYQTAPNPMFFGSGMYTPTFFSTREYNFGISDRDATRLATPGFPSSKGVHRVHKRKPGTVAHRSRLDPFDVPGVGQLRTNSEEAERLDHQEHDH